MTIGLLELKEGGISLEFDEANIDDIKQLIGKRFGDIQNIRKGFAFTVVKFGGEEFTYYYEWDPCLISQSPKGEAMLREIAADAGAEILKPVAG